MNFEEKEADKNLDVRWNSTLSKLGLLGYSIHKIPVSDEYLAIAEKSDSEYPTGILMVNPSTNQIELKKLNYSELKHYYRLSSFFLAKTDWEYRVHRYSHLLNNYGEELYTGIIDIIYQFGPNLYGLYDGLSNSDGSLTVIKGNKSGNNKVICCIHDINADSLLFAPGTCMYYIVRGSIAFTDWRTFEAWFFKGDNVIKFNIGQIILGYNTCPDKNSTDTIIYIELYSGREISLRLREIEKLFDDLDKVDNLKGFSVL